MLKLFLIHLSNKYEHKCLCLEIIKLCLFCNAIKCLKTLDINR